MIKDFLKQYVYLKDTEEYYNLYRMSSVSSATIRSHLLKLGKTDAEIDQIVGIMKVEGVTRSQLALVKKPKLSQPVAVSQSYEIVKSYLGLIRQSTEGIDKLYAIDDKSQVTLCGDCESDKFRSLVVANPKAYDAVRSEFESSPRSTLYQAKFNLKMFIDALYQQFLVDPERLLKETPALISWSPLQPAFLVLNPAILVPGPTPNWDSFLSRINFPEMFMAFIWGVFEPRNTGRQAMWIRGQGSDGKSSAINAIAAFIGRAYVHSIVKGAYDGRFFNSGAYGKRLSIYMDCKNPYILGAEKIKSMLGRDSVEIEKKFENAYTAQLDNKLMILSNHFPKINYADKSERTRLLMVEVATYKDEYGDPDFEKHLKNEFPAFLLRCQEAYKLNCPNDANYHLPKSMIGRIKAECAAKEYEIMENYIESNLILNEGSMLPKLELQREMIGYLQLRDVKEKPMFLESAFSNLLATKGIETIQKGNTTYYKGIAKQAKAINFKEKN